MDLSDVSLTELTAELRKRLRRLLSGPTRRADTAAAAGRQGSPSQAVPSTPPGPLAPAGRAALAARLLAVVLGDRDSGQAAQVAQAFDELAEALNEIAEPLPGSALDNALCRLASGFEDVAMAWDSAPQRELRQAWRNLRDLGDQLWSQPAEPEAAVASGAPSGGPQAEPATGPPPAATAEARSGPMLWLMVAGDLRRFLLQRRLEAAGWTVECLPDVETAISRLAQARPSAVICDDAAPARHRSRLRRVLPAPAFPVVLVQSRPAKAAADQMVWLPPFRTVDLRARLGD